MSLHETFILSARRTPIGAFLGSLSSLTAPELGAQAIQAAVASAGIEGDQVHEVFVGNVLSAGVGQAPARQAALKGGLPTSVGATTVNKVCGSGLQALILARQTLQVGAAEIVVAAGMESMSQTPHYLNNHRGGVSLGNSPLVDGIIHDGLWDPYNNFHMGAAGELCAAKYSLSREAQDNFARESYRRARAAQESGLFQSELIPLTLTHRRKPSWVVDQDEEPLRGRPEKFASLRPAFDSKGTITAANASSLNDGAAALVLASSAAVKKHDLRPLARIVATSTFAQDPQWFTTAPVGAVHRVLKEAQINKEAIDLWEINEAFSCVTMACSHLLELDPNRVNLHGGAVALGHPIGATGARLVTTLLHSLLLQEKKLGLATLCIGGGEALALIIERC